MSHSASKISPEQALDQDAELAPSTEAPIAPVQRRAGRIRQTITGLLLISGTILGGPGCMVYHRNGSSAGVEYDDNRRDVIVLSALGIKNEKLSRRFHRNFEPAIGATILSYIAAPVEFFRILEKFSRRVVQLPLFFAPPAVQVLTTSETDIEEAVMRAESLKN